MGISRTKDEVEADLAQREAELRAANAGPAPAAQLPGDLAQNPQVQALISQAVATAMAPLLGQLQEKRGGSLVGGDREFLEGLALAIQQLADQGKPQAKRAVAPEILAARGRAHEAMIEAILAARAAGEEPEYEVLAPTFLADEMVEPFAPNAKTFMGEIQLNPWQRTENTYGRTRIGWGSIPNQALKPANRSAERIFALFLDSIGAGGTAATRQDDPLRADLKRLESDGVKVRRTQKPAAVRILGTIAEPAQGQY